MGKSLRASMGVIAAVVLMVGCGEGPPVQPNYRGEPLVTLQGQLLLADHVQVDEPVRLALVWYKSLVDSSQPREIVTEDIVYEPSFPVDFTFHLYAPPPPEALAGDDASGRFGVAILVAYRDDNHNGKLDPIPVGGVPQDRVLGATSSYFDPQAPGYTLSYWEDAGGQNGRFMLSHLSGGDSPNAEFVPLDTPITLTLTGENELAALICVARPTIDNAGSPNPLEFCGLPATPDILRVTATFLLRIEETSAGENVQAQTLVLVSDGSQWRMDATVTLNGHPISPGIPATAPDAFPTPGAVSTLVVSAPGVPTATYEIRAPGIPHLTSPESEATFPSGSSLHFAWSPGPFSSTSWEYLLAGSDPTPLWSSAEAIGGSSSTPPSPFDVDTRPIVYTGDAFARLVVLNYGYSRYGANMWSQVEYTRRVSFTP